MGDLRSGGLIERRSERCELAVVEGEVVCVEVLGADRLPQRRQARVEPAADQQQPVSVAQLAGQRGQEPRRLAGRALHLVDHQQHRPAGVLERIGHPGRRGLG